MAGNVTHGMDVNAAGRHADTFDQQAREVRRLKTELDTAVQGAPWYGDDATKFKSTWRSEASNSLEQLASALERVSQTIRSEANAQRTASSGG